MSSIDYQSISVAISNAASTGTNIISAVRQAVGYSIDELAVASGLSAGEIETVEANPSVDPDLLARIATALGIPASILPSF